jgi:hypothetical protein
MEEGPSESASSRPTFDSILPDNSSYQTPPTTQSSLPPSSAPIAPSLPAAARRQFAPAQGPIGFDKAEGPTSVPFLPGVTADLSDRCLSLQLTAVYRHILGCKEAMWEELGGGCSSAVLVGRTCSRVWAGTRRWMVVGARATREKDVEMVRVGRGEGAGARARCLGR